MAIFGKFSLLQVTLKYVFDSLPCKKVEPKSSNSPVWAGLCSSKLSSRNDAIGLSRQSQKSIASVSLSLPAHST